MPKIVQFAPFQSAVEAPFWHALAKKKLDIFQLSDDEQAIVGFYTSGQSVQDASTGRSVEIPPRLSVSNESLEFSPLEALQKYLFVCVLLVQCLSMSLNAVSRPIVCKSTTFQLREI
jgi:hypothetical protein